MEVQSSNLHKYVSSFNFFIGLYKILYSKYVTWWRSENCEKVSYKLFILLYLHWRMLKCLLQRLWVIVLKICSCSAPSVSKIFTACAIFDLYLTSYVAVNAHSCRIVWSLFNSDQGYQSQDVWNLTQRMTVQHKADTSQLWTHYHTLKWHKLVVSCVCNPICSLLKYSHRVHYSYSYVAHTLLGGSC